MIDFWSDNWFPIPNKMFYLPAWMIPCLSLKTAWQCAAKSAPVVIGTLLNYSIHFKIHIAIDHIAYVNAQLW